MIQRVVAAGFLCHDGRVLLIRRAKDEHFLPGTWEIPGGKADFGETPQQACAREFFEETGCTISVGRPFHTYSYYSPNRQKHFTEIDFMVIGDIGEVRLSRDHDAYAWAAEGELARFEMTPEMREVINKGFVASSETYRRFLLP